MRLDEVTDTVHELWAFHQLADLVPANPREMKGLVNVHRLVRIINKTAGVHPSAANPEPPTAKPGRSPPLPMSD